MPYNSFEEMSVWRKAMDMAVEIFYLTEGLSKTIAYFAHLEGLLKSG